MEAKNLRLQRLLGTDWAAEKVQMENCILYFLLNMIAWLHFLRICAIFRPIVHYIRTGVVQ